MAGDDLPWMKFYPSDFRGSSKVQAMDAEEVGMYLLLLCQIWDEGSIPDNPDQLWMVCKTTPDNMRRAWPKLRSCMKEHPDRDGQLTHKRVEKERRDALDRRARASRAAQAKQDQRAGRSAEGSAGRTAGRSAPGGATRAPDSEAQNTEALEETDTQPPRANGGVEDVAERDWAVVLTKLRDRRSKVLDQLSDDGSYALEQIGGMDTLTGSRVDDVRHIRRDFMNVHPRSA